MQNESKAAQTIDRIIKGREGCYCSECNDFRSAVREAYSAAIEDAARIAEGHGSTIGENCWNHENRKELAESTCWQEIAAVIRSLKGNLSDGEERP